ncbi:MAG: hypothetical protein AAFX87_17955 [Bacteroidota bacterium]
MPELNTPFSTDSRTRQQIILILRIVCFAVFAGRAWQHLFWDAPFRTLLWDESLLKPVIELLTNMSWYEYVTSETTDAYIQGITRCFGFFYLMLAFMALFVKGNMKAIGRMLLVGAFCLAFLAFLYCKEKFFHVGQFFEYSAQFMSPILLYLALFSQIKVRSFVLIAKTATALTFICHGLYAVNFYPRPGNFVDMVINILGISEPAAHTILMVAGIMDFVIAFGMFMPHAARVSLIYAVIWGVLTSLARIVANFDMNFAGQTLHQWTFETVYRIPHAGLPLVALILEGFSWRSVLKPTLFKRAKLETN